MSVDTDGVADTADDGANASNNTPRASRRFMARSYLRRLARANSNHTKPFPESHGRDGSSCAGHPLPRKGHCGVFEHSTFASVGLNSARGATPIRKYDRNTLDCAETPYGIGA